VSNVAVGHETRWLWVIICGGGSCDMAVEQRTEDTALGHDMWLWTGNVALIEETGDVAVGCEAWLWLVRCGCGSRDRRWGCNS
jgi:hypothetical protein